MSWAYSDKLYKQRSCAAVNNEGKHCSTLTPRSDEWKQTRSLQAVWALWGPGGRGSQTLIIKQNGLFLAVCSKHREKAHKADGISMTTGPVTWPASLAVMNSLYFTMKQKKTLPAKRRKIRLYKENLCQKLIFSPISLHFYVLITTVRINHHNKLNVSNAAEAQQLLAVVGSPSLWREISSKAWKNKKGSQNSQTLFNWLIPISPHCIY